MSDLVDLRLYRSYCIPIITSRKIDQQLVEPFKVLKRISRLTYQLKLPDNIRIYDVISIAYLEPATDPAQDPY